MRDELNQTSELEKGFLTALCPDTEVQWKGLMGALTFCLSTPTIRAKHLFCGGVSVGLTTESMAFISKNYSLYSQPTGFV